MKKLIAILLSFIMVMCMMPSALVFASGNTYYVSPSGDDIAGDGSEGNPWATLCKAAQELQAGDTAIFADGTYEETEYTVFSNSGTDGAPITIKAENKHGAIISYAENLNREKLDITKSYITVQDFVITQEGSHETSKDILLNCGIGKGNEIEGCQIIGNKFYNVYEEGIKVKYVKNAVIKDNIVENSIREGMDIFGCIGAVISENKVINCGRVGYMLKGNSRNCLVYNNIVQNTSTSCTHGYQIGGSSDGNSPYITADGVGFEAYNCVFYNNIAYASSKDFMGKAFSFSGSTDCHAYNNIAYGAKNGFSFSKASNDAWGWYPPTVRPTLYNNIVMNVSKAYDFVDGTPEGMISDYNLFYNVAAEASIPAAEGNSIVSDPCFVNASLMDFTLKPASPARALGKTLPTTVDAYDGIADVDTIDTTATVSIPQVDFDGNARQTPWDMGVYNRGKDISVELLSEDFEGAAINTVLKGYNGWQGEATSSTKIVREEICGNDSKYAEIMTQSDYVYKELSADIYKGKVAVEMQLLRTGENAKRFTIVALKDDNTNLLDFNFRFHDGKTPGNGTFDVPPLDNNKWLNFELILDVTPDDTVIKGKYYVYLDEKLKKSTSTSSAVFRSVGAVSIGASMISGDSFRVDNISALKLGELAVNKVIPTADGNLSTAEVFFSHNIDSSTVLPSNISVGTAGVNVTKMESINGSKRHFRLTFNKALEPETTYSLTFNGFSDYYSDVMGQTQTISNVTAQLTTRDAITHIGDIKFYSVYNTETKTEATSLTGFSNGNITVALDIVNEKSTLFNSALIAVHKRGGKIISIKADDVAISKGTDVKKLDFINVSEGDCVEAYLWNSVQGMQPIANGKVIDTATVTDIPLNAETVISSIDNVSALLSPVTSRDDMKITVNAAAAKENAAVTALVLKPDKVFNSLTASNLAAYVDFVGQGVLNEQKKCTFDYIVTDGQNNKTYTAYVGGNKVLEKEMTQVLFRSSVFMKAVIKKIDTSTADEIAAILAGGKTTIKDENGVVLAADFDVNEILMLDLTDYNTLTDYTTRENFKKRVSIALHDESFAEKGIEDIVSVFNESVSEQKVNEQAYKALLAKINADVWSALETTLTTNNATVLYEAYTGSYNSIKNDASLREAFYKKLANDYTFNNFDELRTAFENEAKNLIPTGTTPVPEPDYGGGGGGGGGSAKYSNDLITPQEATPLEKEVQDGSKNSFNDISDVQWAREAILALSDANIINGVADGKFAPHANVTREQFVKMIVLAFDLYDADASLNGFIDVEAGQWHEKYIASAVNSAIIYGVDHEHFGVGKELSRAEMATICYRAAVAAGKTFPENDAHTYSDNADIPQYAKEAIAAMSGAGIINGIGNNLFAPSDKATRAMAAKVCYLLRGEM